MGGGRDGTHPTRLVYCVHTARIVVATAPGVWLMAGVWGALLTGVGGASGVLPPPGSGAVPKCTEVKKDASGGSPACHGWSTVGSVTNVSMTSFSCSTTVPPIPKWFMQRPANSSEPHMPTHYLYCNVVADGVVGAAPQQQFGQILTQLMIGDVETCHGPGRNGSALGPGSHIQTDTWLAQSQYFFVDTMTKTPMCSSAAIVEASPGDRVEMAVVFSDGQWIATMTVVSVHTRGVAGTSTLVIPNPQLDPTLSWSKLFPGPVLRPYAAFESWDAAADAADAYPTGPWHADLFSDTGVKFAVWAGPQAPSTAMAVSLPSPDHAVWLYGPPAVELP